MPNRRRSDGFTLIEMAIVLAVVSLIAIIGLPALLNTIARTNLTNSARETAALLRAARFDAIKHSTSTTVKADTGTREVVAFIDSNANCVIDGTDTVIGTFSVPRGVDMKGPGGSGSFTGFKTAGGMGCARFLFDGTAEFFDATTTFGAFRFTGQGGDSFEARVQPAATGHVSVQKYFPADTEWFRNGESGHNWWS